MPPEDYTPEVDTSFGLIYRLNYLWAKADREALNGEYKKWELTLDTLFRNLLYRNPIETEEDGEEIKEAKLSDKDSKIWRKLKQDVSLARKNINTTMKSKNIGQINLAKQKYYESLMFYDIWVRKFMQELKLYMKEAESNPAFSLFGRTLKKRAGKNR